MLEDEPRVGPILAIARHHRDPGDLGWRRTEVAPIDVRDRAAIGRALDGADVVVHLAFQIYGLGADEAALFEVNVRGTHNVARAAALGGACRFVHASSGGDLRIPGRGGGAAAGDQPVAPARPPLLLAPQGAGGAAGARGARRQRRRDLRLPPCAILGPHAAGAVFNRLPGSLVRAAVTRGAIGALRAGLPLPPGLAWPEVMIAPLLLDIAKARRELGWTPRHSSRETLAETRLAAGI